MGRTPDPIGVAIADAGPRDWALLALALGRHPDIEVVGSAADECAAVDLIAIAEPDVVVIDVRLPHLVGGGLCPPAATLTLGCAGSSVVRAPFQAAADPSTEG